MRSILVFAALALAAAAAFGRAKNDVPESGNVVGGKTSRNAVRHEIASDTSDTSTTAQSKYAQDSATAMAALARSDFGAGKYAAASKEFRASIGFVDDIDGRLWLYFAEWKSSGNKVAADHLKQYINQAQAEHALTTPFIESLFEAILRDGGEDVVFREVAKSDPKFQTMLTFKANFYLGMNNLMEGAKITARKYWTKCIASGLTQLSEYEYVVAHYPK